MRRFFLRLLRRARLEEDLDAELALHRELAAAAGNPIPLGSTLKIKEASRDLWRFGFVEDWWRDVRYAVRALAGQPAFTIFALLALVMGIGLNVWVFTGFNEMALKPWAVRDPGRVVRFESSEFSVAEYRYVREHARSFSGVVLEAGPTPVIVDGQEWWAQFVSGNYFAVLDLQMALGRGFGAAGDGMAAPEGVVVLGHALWRTQYGADPGVLGRRIRLNGVPFSVIGVASPRLALAPRPVDLWIPAASMPAVDPENRELFADEAECCFIAARLAKGVTRSQAQAEMEVVSRRLHAARAPGPEPPRHVKLAGTRVIDGDNTGSIVRTFLSAQVVAAAILLLACANVGNLMLARASARHREIGVRMSLGAGRWRVVRQLLTEGLLLTVAASVLTVLIVYVYSALSTLRETPSPGIRVTTIRAVIDTRVTIYAAGAALLAAIVCGLAPALQATRKGLMNTMKQQSAQATARLPLRGALLGVQVAISMTVLVCAALLARSVRNAATLDPGFHGDGVSVVSVTLPWKQYLERGSRPFIDEMRDQLRPFGPVGVTDTPPPRRLQQLAVTLPSRDSHPSQVSVVNRGVVDGGYFDVLRIPLAAGRHFVPEDRDRHAVLVNEAMVRRYWAGSNPIGQEIRYAVTREGDWVWDAAAGGLRPPSTVVSHEIVGVVRDARLAWPEPVEPSIFQLHDGRNTTFTLLVPEATSGMAAAIIRRLESQASVSTTSLSTSLDMQIASARAAMRLAFALGLLALVLATVGVYGVIAYTVEQRWREIGIRMALGARSGQLIAVVAGRNAGAILGGLAAGVVLSLGASKALEGWLYGVSRLDPLAYGAVLALLFAAGAVASAIPARRATRIDPSRVLHAD